MDFIATNPNFNDIIFLYQMKKQMISNNEINLLIVVNVASEQVTVLMDELNLNRFYFTLIDNTGGFFDKPTHTLFIGINKNRYEDLIQLITKYCKKQRTHIATQTQMEINLQPHQPIIIEAETGGATIYTIPVEYFEQY